MAITFQEASDYLDRVIFRPRTRWSMEHSYGEGDPITLYFYSANLDTSDAPDYERVDQEMAASIQFDLSQLENLDQFGRKMLEVAWKYDHDMWLHEHTEFFRVRMAEISNTYLDNATKDSGRFGRTDMIIKIPATDFYDAPFHPHKESGKRRWNSAKVPEAADPFARMGQTLP